MTSRHFNLSFFISTLLFVSTILITNLLIDPFNIFNTGLLKQRYQANERFIKINYLHENHVTFDSYMFGSSRIGFTNPAIIEKYILNSKFYNFTLSAANFSDYLAHLNYFIEEKYPIKNIYFQIDVASLAHYGHPDDFYLLKMHPYVTGKNKFIFYIDYLTHPMWINIKGKLLANLQDQNHSLYNWEKGYYSKPYLEESIQNNCQKYYQTEPSFQLHTSRNVRGTAIAQSIAALKKIKKLCDENHINLIVFITPHNQHMMDAFVLEDYFNYLQQIAYITDYYDFSGYNTITTNDCNYYETSHYRPLVGELIAARIFHDSSINVPHDFGKLVTKSSINDHLIFLKKQIYQHEKSTIYHDLVNFKSK